MPLSPISGAGSSINFELLRQASPVKAGSDAGTGQAFGEAITGAFGRLNALQTNTDALAQQAATGELKSPADYMIAATETQLTTQLTVAVRNKAVEAYNEIIKMQV